jgi:general secretion pathway protein G
VEIVMLLRTLKSFKLRLAIVMAIISVLAPITLLLHRKSTVERERLLKNQLFTLRTVIDEYTFDKKKAPQSLQDLVREGYLRAVPADPITGNENWVTVPEETLLADRARPGILDVRSAASRKSLSGTPYSQW